MATNLVQKGFALIGMKRPDDAKATFYEALAADPNDMDAVLGAACCEVALGNKKLALELAKRAAPEAAKTPFQWTMYCAVLIDAGKTKHALEATHEGVRLFPHSPDAHEMLAEAATRMRKKKEALAASLKALELDANNADAHTTHAGVALAFDKAKTAEQSARNALEIDPNDQSALTNLVLALEGQSKHKEVFELSLGLAVANPENRRIVGVARRQLLFLGYLPFAAVAVVLLLLGLAHATVGFSVLLEGEVIFFCGLAIAVRQRRLPAHTAETALRFYRQKWYWRIFLPPRRLMFLGVALIAAGGYISGARG